MLPWLPAAAKSALSAKTSMCQTYEANEMALESLECDRIVTAPGDVFHLPRRTIHSARAVAGEMSGPLTLGIKSCNRRHKGGRGPGRRDGAPPRGVSSATITRTGQLDCRSHVHGRDSRVSVQL